MEETPTQEVPTNEVEEAPEVQPEETQEEPSQESTEEPEGQVEKPAEEEPQERPQSRREALRIAKLAERRAEQIVKNQKPQQLDYAKELDADPEVIDRLTADRESYAKSQVDPVLEQVQSVQWNTRLEIDAPRVEGKYPQLDKGSDKFDPVVADALNSHYLNLVGFNPQTGSVSNPHLRYADFIEAQFELAGALATEQAVQTTKNVAKQAAATGLRPGGNSAKRLNLDQAPETMSDEELDAAIAQTIPRDSRGRYTKN